MLGAFSRPQPPPAGGPGDRDAMELVCPVCLEIFDSPMVTQCGHKSVSAGVPPELLSARCLPDLPELPGCRIIIMVVLSKMKDHTGSCSKYQDYIQEGLKSIKKNQPKAASPVPNRYTFLCPYCREPNLDQDGLVEHCNSQHARDPRPVVSLPFSLLFGRGLFLNAVLKNYIYNFMYLLYFNYSIKLVQKSYLNCAKCT
uniref:RING-type E3 ubiquitin transferase n=1 Tax=Astyanax mexicanus TaxID=7994 RepID=A0A8B9HMM8_ASTMX